MVQGQKQLMEKLTAECKTLTKRLEDTTVKHKYMKWKIVSLFCCFDTFWLEFCIDFAWIEWNVVRGTRLFQTQARPFDCWFQFYFIFYDFVSPSVVIFLDDPFTFGAKKKRIFEFDASSLRRTKMRIFIAVLTFQCISLTLGFWLSRAQTGKKHVRFSDGDDYALVGYRPTTNRFGTTRRTQAEASGNELSSFGFECPKAKRRAIYCQ